MLKPHKNIARTFALLPLATTLLMAAANATAQECKNRGDLDAMYCDENKDLVADASGEAFNRANYDKQTAKEAEAAKKKAAEAKKP